MSGKFEFASSDGGTIGRHGRVMFCFEPMDGSGVKRLVFDDARNFGTVRCCSNVKELEDKLGTIGPDILEVGEGELTAEDFVGIVRGLRTNPNVCKFLMNQKRLSGVGNYILAEGLYKANVDPWIGVKDVEDETLKALITALKETATTSFQAQGLTRSSGGTFRSLDGSKGKFEFKLMVYGKETCPKGEKVWRIVDGPHGRAIWFVMSQVEEGRREKIRLIAEKKK